MSRLKADILLLLTAFIWGTAFVAQKQANGFMGPIGFVGVRFILSALILAPFAWREAQRSTVRLGHKDVLTAILIGVCLFSGAMLQQIGMVTTTATNGGFLTALYVVLVPFIVWFLSGHRPRFIVVLACFISI